MTVGEKKNAYSPSKSCPFVSKHDRDSITRIGCVLYTQSEFTVYSWGDRFFFMLKWILHTLKIHNWCLCTAATKRLCQELALLAKKPAAAMILFHPFFLLMATDLLAGLPVERANEAVGVGWNLLLLSKQHILANKTRPRTNSNSVCAWRPRVGNVCPSGWGDGHMVRQD